MEKLILCRIFLVDFLEGLLGVEEGVVGEEVYRFGVAELQFFLDYHDELEDGEGLEDEDSRLGAGTCCCRIILACSASLGSAGLGSCQGGTCGSSPPTFSGPLASDIYNSRRIFTQADKTNAAKSHRRRWEQVSLGSG